MAETKAPEYGTRAYWKSVLAQKSTKTDSAGRDLVITGQGAAGPIYCTRQYASDCLYLLTSRKMWPASLPMYPEVQN